MDLTVIIVNYKAPQLLLDCLKSIHQFETTGIEIIVVDNFSGDNIENLLLEQYPAVKFIQMGYNAGFARANNAGIKSAKGSSVLLLNSDTIIEDNTINKVHKEFCNSNFVACGVQLLNIDRTPQISGNYAMRGGLNYLLPLPFLGSFLKLSAGVFNIKKPNIPDSNDIVEVDWINGAFLMIKKNIDFVP
jgi:GT2 family glycosyltransferase